MSQVYDFFHKIHKNLSDFGDSAKDWFDKHVDNNHPRESPQDFDSQFAKLQGTSTNPLSKRIMDLLLNRPQTSGDLLVNDSDTNVASNSIQNTPSSNDVSPQQIDEYMTGKVPGDIGSTLAHLGTFPAQVTADVGHTVENGVSDIIDDTQDDNGDIFDKIGKILNNFLDDPATYWDYFRNGKANEYNLEQTKLTNQANLQATSETNKANIDIANSTNAVNRDIAEQNLGFQRELQEYNKALQDRIFEREDTSYQRTANDMLSAGINPLSMNSTNGSGQVVSQTPLNNSHVEQQASASIPAQFERFQMQSAGLSDVLSSFASITQQAQSIFDGKLRRDSLRAQTDKQILDNSITSVRYGFSRDYTPRYPWSMRSDVKNKAFGSAWASDLNSKRELNHKINAGIYDTDLREERLLTSIEDWLTNGRFEHFMNSLTDSGQKLLNKLFN